MSYARENRTYGDIWETNTSWANKYMSVYATAKMNWFCVKGIHPAPNIMYYVSLQSSIVDPAG